MGDGLTASLINGTDGHIDTDFAIRQLAQENANREFKSLDSPKTGTDLSQSEGKIDYKNKTIRSVERMWSLDQSSHRKTPHAIYSERTSLGTCLSQVHQELAEHRMLLEQIQEAIKCKEINGKTQIMDSLTELQCLEDDEPTSEHSSARASTCLQSERFSDCDSRFSQDDFYSLHNEWSRPCTPSPAGYLELSSSFCPERFTIDGLFQDPFFVLGKKLSDTSPWTHEYYILYAETPRRWRRLKISANFEGLPHQASIFGPDAPHESEQHSIALPTIVGDHVNRQLSYIGQFNSVTHLSLYFGQDKSGSIFNDPARAKISEDCLEICQSGEDQMLRDINDLECKPFLESDIITQSRKSCSCFIVHVESRICIERKAPFVNSGIRGGNGFQSFFDDLKLLKSLQSYKGVAEFIGVVLDDARTHLRSYLYEYPALGSILTMFIGAQSRSEIIPWDIREIWARQIVKTVAEIHSGRGSLVGGLFWLAEIGIRANGTIVFTALRSSQKYYAQRYFTCRPGMTAPELRGVLSTDDSALEKMVTFRTEVFQLGLLLWMLAEHKDNTAGCFCSRSACTNWPRYMCTLDHTDPIELPLCSAEIPPYFNEIIKQCRSSDPKDRKTACQLQEMFPPTEENDNLIPAHGIDILKRCARLDMFAVYCNECGSRDMSVSYRCNQCYEDEFDLCEPCFDQGISCPDLRHRLVKRFLTDQRTFKVVPD